MIVDAHQHVFWHRTDDAGLIADMDEHGIDRAWVLTWDVPPHEDAPEFHSAFNPAHARSDGTHPGLPLSDIIRARDTYPDRLVPGYCPDPRLRMAPDLFAAAVEMHGVRVCGEWKFRMLIDDPRCIELFRRAGALNCPVTLHLDVPYRAAPDGGEARYCHGWYGGTIENLQRAVRACPQTIFLGHAPGFWREISGDADTDPELYPNGPVTKGGRLYRVLDENPNLFLDLSAGSARGALSRDPRNAREFLCRYADRVLFARDMLGNQLDDFLKTLDLPSDVQDALYSGNALKLVPAP